MPFGRDYHPRIAERPARGGEGRNLVHAADHNARVTLEALRRGGARTRPELADLTGLTTPGISNVIRRLQEAGLIRPVSGGRAARFAIEPEGAFAMGIDVAATAVSAAIVDLTGTVRIRERLHAASTAEEDIAAAVRAVAFAGASRLPASLSDRLAGIGIAEVAEPARLVQALAPFPVIVERDSVCAALGERMLGSAPPDGSFVHVLFGQTVRAGLMIRGSLYDGVNHRAGRIGQMRTGEDGRLLDEVAGVAEILPLLVAHFDRGDHRDDFLASLGAGEAALVDRWLERTCEHFLDAVVAISGFIAPGAIFVGGRLPSDLLRELSRRLALGRADRLIGPTKPQWLPEIVPAALGSNSVLLGAAILPFLEHLLPDPRRSPELRATPAEA